MILIGIDPAFRKSGHAIGIIDESGLIRFKVFKDFISFMGWITDPEEVPKKSVLVGIENSNLSNATFWTHKDKSGKMYTASQARRVPGLTPLSKSETARVSRNVGANQAASQITVDLCRWLFGADRVVELSPEQKGRKWTDAEFTSVRSQERHRLYKSNYKGLASEQDKRDAYQIALQARRYYSFKAAKIKIR